MKRRYYLRVNMGDSVLLKLLLEVSDHDYAEALTVGDCFDMDLVGVLSEWAVNYLEMVDIPYISWSIQREQVERVPVPMVLTVEADPRD